jgi:hypothetical protein
MNSSTLLPMLAIAPYAAVALGLALTLLLFVSLKAELYRNTRRERKRLDEVLARLEEAQGSGPAPLEQVFVPVSLPAGFNLNRRVHALRLLRKENDVARVAAILGVPRTEIELLVRVQKMNGQDPPAQLSVATNAD